MKLQRLAGVVLSLFVAGLVSATTGEALHSPTRTDQVNHSEGSSCPDPGNDGGPCGPTCPCACCPGHSTTTASTPDRLFIGAPPSGTIEASLPDDFQPEDVVYRIFHPPRD